MNELLVEITSPATSVVKPVRVFSGELRLGADILSTQTSNPSGSMQDENCLCIKVEAFPATKAVSGLNRKTAVEVEDSQKKESEDDQSGSSYIPVTISKDSVTKAYRYGADYVVLPSVLVDQTVYESFPGLDLRGFWIEKLCQGTF
ncbi:CGH_1_HP_G0101200.mRNA.1.CDS.1 [Saccharomyces cerevisiae]|nr:CGH_1_HP_G0101200.mRNA.1.CDS.1 [Saccharomyces cerevisiae]CAI6948147.1 CGH_1_HP_G0101200.mRNA.1.CDS.1 [Saccharomyces cerevisiae]